MSTARRSLITAGVLIAAVVCLAPGISRASTAASMGFGVYVDHATGRLDRQYQAWADSSLEPVVPGLVDVFGASYCGGWFGCSSFAPGPNGAAIHADSRDTFLFEEGHLLDWMLLTRRERMAFARIWGVFGKPWNNSPVRGARPGDEDGLTADFGGAYRSCAEGDRAQGLAIGDAPPIALHNTCTLIRRWL